MRHRQALFSPLRGEPRAAAAAAAAGPPRDFLTGPRVAEINHAEDRGGTAVEDRGFEFWRVARAGN